MSALLLTGCTCVMTFSGGLLALRLETQRAFVLAFAAGALVASALMDVIPDALDLLERSSPSPDNHHRLLLACCLGFLAFYLLEQTAHDVADPHEPLPGQGAGLWGTTGIGVHSLLDGVAIGEAFDASAGVGWAVALAVIVHKFADGVSAVGILMSTGQDDRLAKTTLLLVALAPLVGLTLQHVVSLPLSALAIVLGWFAGVFLYLGAAALIPAAHAASRSRYLPLATLSGVALVYVIHRAAH
jgi:ZIP family zinc transporter